MYLIGVESITQENKGYLYLLHFDSEEGISTKKDVIIEDVTLDLKYLGECSVPSSLTYMGNKFVFLGSTKDDCQLI